MIAQKLNKLIDDGYILVFDLDDTLYLEYHYLKLAYKYLADTFVPNESTVAHEFLCNEFLKYGREGLFNKFIEEFCLNCSLNELLNVFRNVDVRGKLYFFDWFYTFIESKDREYIVNIVTNGNVLQQQNKVSSLFDSICHNICVSYANEFKPKPSQLAFSKLNHLDKSKVIYIGDSKIDECFSLNIGVKFMNINKL